MGRFEKIAPWFFVFIWSSGFVVAKYAFKSSDVLFFLSVRLLIAAAVLAILTVALGGSLKLSRRDLLASLFIGICLHAIYLGGVWQAIAEGSPSGIASVITSLQPVLVSIIAIFLLGEKLAARQLVGLFLGLAGVVLVLQPSFSKGGSMTISALALLILALAGSTSSTLAQKKIGHSIALLPGTTYQFLIAGLALGALSLITGKTHLQWNTESSLAMAWAVVVTSIIAILLLLWMLNRGSAARVTSLLYLVPATTALQAYFLFREELVVQSMIGIILTGAGVALVQRK